MSLSVDAAAVFSIAGHNRFSVVVGSPVQMKFISQWLNSRGIGLNIIGFNSNLVQTDLGGYNISIMAIYRWHGYPVNNVLEQSLLLILILMGNQLNQISTYKFQPVRLRISNWCWHKVSRNMSSCIDQIFYRCSKVRKNIRAVGFQPYYWPQDCRYIYSQRRIYILISIMPTFILLS